MISTILLLLLYKNIIYIYADTFSLTVLDTRKKSVCTILKIKLKKHYRKKRWIQFTNIDLSLDNMIT